MDTPGATLSNNQIIRFVSVSFFLFFSVHLALSWALCLDLYQCLECAGVKFLKLRRIHCDMQRKREPTKNTTCNTVDSIWNKNDVGGCCWANMIVSSEPQKTIALGTAWQPTFNRTAFILTKLRHIWITGVILKNTGMSLPPAIGTAGDTIGKGPSTLPGPDARPCPAWKACGDTGICSLMLIDADLRNGGDPDPDFNISSMAFLVTGEDDHDAISVLRDPLSTRPL